MEDGSRISRMANSSISSNFNESMISRGRQSNIAHLLILKMMNRVSVGVVHKQELVLSLCPILSSNKLPGYMIERSRWVLCDKSDVNSELWQQLLSNSLKEVSKEYSEFLLQRSLLPMYDDFQTKDESFSTKDHSNKSPLMDILKRSDIFVEYPPQTRVEGEIQQLDDDHPVIELWEVMTGVATGRTSESQITLFDSVGFAIEDFSALRYVLKNIEGTAFFDQLDMLADPDDPRDLFGMLERSKG